VLIFFIGADTLNLPEIPVSIGCFLIAGTQNYLIDHQWTFAGKAERPSIHQWLLFLGGSLAGLGINITVMRLVILTFTLPYKFIAQACGIAAGMGVNFIISKCIVFRRKR